MTISLITLIAAAVYLGFLCWCVVMWKRNPKNEKTAAHQQTVTIVVPARDEAENIEKILFDLSKQDYPRHLMQVVVVDDHSTDQTLQVCKKFKQENPELRLECFSLTETSSKKAAIAWAVESSKYEWILTTDADVSVPSRQWLTRIMAHGAVDVDMICGPVLFSCNDTRSLIRELSALESIGLTAIAAAGIKSRHPFYCNGANLAFRRDAFLRVNGYDGSKDRMTGDDTALLLKFPPASVRYAQHREAAVHSVPPPDGTGFLSQRQRWASKIPYALSWSTLVASVFAWLAHAGFICCTAGFFVGGGAAPLFLGIWLSKAVVEYGLLKAVGDFFDRRVAFMLILMLQPTYALAITIIGFASVFMPYHWKGRKGN